MPILNLDALRRAPLVTEPFFYSVVPGFIHAASAATVREDFPKIVYPGLLPIEATAAGPRLKALIAEFTGPQVTAVLSEKFQLDLTGRPTMVTLRGRCQRKDGRIHTDSDAKLLTALLYFNAGWEAEGGRLRLLRSKTDLGDILTEVPPELGTLVAFKRSDNSFHGHAPYVGVRRYLMINWMRSGAAAQRELLRHQLSAQTKKLLPHG